MSPETKLYWVKFKMDDFVDAAGNAWENVIIILFVDAEGRETLVPYEVGIKDYDSSQDTLREFSLRNLFSADEAQRLINYLKEHEGLEAEMDEVKLPIASIWPWYEETMDACYQGFMGVSELICSDMGLRIAAFFDLRDGATRKVDP